MASKKAAVPDLETALTELETLVETLERGDLGLEDALKQFERGMELSRVCQVALASAEQRVELLQNRAGEEALVPFGAPAQD
ncbi:exodeoxyribonuclease VII small subunit [Plasticicumulans lactativorans]|uniref:Exodeoxyribonuclease 7 small subunit n=1 Tax=Plasticicumulans lactativorans TaxID=1133106 RepID=A0A4R2LR61_9GAMM|nr:exodeoxyribonuclease VII small subunit [Plasticicumulans lactativorans]TCO82081.1 exodeoxyribonuclease VII small subunit [Plasticicumulans lactativorans]